VQAGEAGRWTIVFETGPGGIASGGLVFFQTSPFWGWSPPRLTDDGPGYTVVEALGDDIEIEPLVLDRGLLAARIVGRPLVAGDRIRFVYGAGQWGARADQYAERDERFFVAVDGDGDGVRSLLADCPRVDIVAGPPARLVAIGPSIAEPGQEVELSVVVLDALGNSGVVVEGVVRVKTATGESAGEPQRLEAAEPARAIVKVATGAAGVRRYRVTLESPRGEAWLEGESNPIAVGGEWPPVRWADLHGHSGLSDGTGTPEDYFRYARDVARLDVVALTDHDHWGMEPLSGRPDLWRRISVAVEAFHDPGRFVTLHGYEWTNWLHGHRHVLYFGDSGSILDSVSEAYEHPAQLWAALRDRNAMTFAHHSAGGPVATNWDIPPDPELEPLTEIVSVHGSSEAEDSPRPIYAAVSGNFVRDALDRGYRLGFLGSGDGHDGHPGLTSLTGTSGGLAAILAPELTRASVSAALRSRRVYATNGPRILLDVSLGRHRPGEILSFVESTSATRLHVRAAGAGELAGVDVIRPGVEVDTHPVVSGRDLDLTFEVEPLAAGEYLYVRVRQRDGGTAWSSPFFVD